MTSKEVVFAELRSKNSLSLEFPYNGSNFGTLVVRQHPKYGLDVIVSVDKGQILCSSYSECPISIRFDDARPATRQGNPPDDHSRTSAFLSDPKWFIQRAAKAKRILIQLNMYQAGGQVLEFDTVENLQWPPAKDV